MSLRPILNAIVPLVMAAPASLLLDKWTGQKTNGWHFSLLFFFAMHLVLALLYLKKFTEKEFPAFLLGSVVVKLICCLVYLVILSIVTSSFQTLAFHFLLQFLVFSLSEIFYVLRLMKSRSD